MDNAIPNNWQKVKLGDISNIRSGDFVPKEERKDGGVVPMYGSGGIVSYTNRSNISGPTIVVGRVGAFGTVNLVENGLATDNTLIVTNKPDTDINYLYYKMGTVPFGSIATGSSQQLITQTAVAAHETVIPPLEEQKQIVSILSAFDDKIEVNNKIAITLQDLAQAIFKEWFVKDKKAVWETGKLSDIANITMGQSPSSKFYNKDKKGLPFHQGVTNFGERYIKNHDIYCSTDGRIAEQGDILFSVRAPVGRINIADRKLVIGRGLSAIGHKHHQQSFLFYLLKWRLKTEDSLGSGSVFPATTKEELNNFEITIPDDKITQKFENIVSVYDEKIKMAYLENQKLAALRDLLLPKLMRGEIRV